MDPKLFIKIPEPCHEDFSKMTPKDNGSYCGSCEKTVVDFSKMNDEQIALYVAAHPNEKMCGRFTSSQLNRPLSFAGMSKSSFLKMFVYILFIVFGAGLFAFTYVQNNNDRTVGELVVNTDTIKKEELMPPGMMMPYVEPLAGGDTAADVIEDGREMGEMVMDVDTDALTGDVRPSQDVSYALGGMVCTTETIINDPINNFPGDTASSLEKKDPVKQEIIDAPKLPTLESYPNPASGSVNIKYTIPVRTDVLIEIYDINGKKMKDLVSTSQLYEGTYIYPADLSELSSGTYICRMVAGEKSYSTKILVQK